MQKTVEIKFKEQVLEVSGWYTKAENGTRLDPPSDSMFEIELIQLKGIDLGDLLEDYIMEIEELCLTKIEE